MPIKKFELIQINATIIAGIFIMLTISNIIEETTSNELPSNEKILTLIMIFPFSVSAIIEGIHAGKNNQEAKKDSASKYSIGFTTIGFIYLLMSFSYILLR